VLRTLSNCIFVRVVPTQKTGAREDRAVMLGFDFPPVICGFAIYFPLPFSKISTEREGGHTDAEQLGPLQWVGTARQRQSYGAQATSILAPHSACIHSLLSTELMSALAHHSRRYQWGYVYTHIEKKKKNTCMYIHF